MRHERTTQTLLLSTNPERHAHPVVLLAYDVQMLFSGQTELEAAHGLTENENDESADMLLMSVTLMVRLIIGVDDEIAPITTTKFRTMAIAELDDALTSW